MELRANGVSAASPRQGLFTSAIHPHIIDNVLLRERVEVDTLTSAPASAESEIEYQIKRTVERPCLPAVFVFCHRIGFNPVEIPCEFILPPFKTIYMKIGGHDLVEDFRNLWAYSYVKDYKYTADNNLEWVGDGSKETVFSIKYSSLANDWNSPQQKSNQICLYSGFRNQNYTKTFPFGQGWGMGTVNPKIYEDWDPNDLRRDASVLDARNTDEVADFDFGGGNQQDLTCYWQKKYIPINVWTDETKTAVYNFSHELYSMTGTDYQRDNIQDLILIRFSDVLLMAAELGAPNAQQYLDRVRNRVGLASVPVTLENIKAERRFELAFEGVRYYDLLRWHDEDLITINQTGIVTYNRRGQANAETKSITFRKETGGFLPIPQTQIDLSGGVLTQNAGWEGGDIYLN